MTAPNWKPTTIALILALAYFITGRLGLMLPAFGSTITLIWLPTGIAVAALLRYGFGCWPGIALGAVAVNLAIGQRLPLALAIAVGNTLGPLLAAWTLRRVDFRPTLDRKHDILLLTLAALLGMIVCASVGVTSLSLAGALRDGPIGAWLTWWAGDTMGVIIAAPLVFAFTVPKFRAIQYRRAEFTAWLGITALVSWGVFVLNSSFGGPPWALAFLPLPMVAWGALRYGPVGTSVAVIVISVGAAYGTSSGHGPFYRPESIEAVAVLWVFMATSAALGWLISALKSASVQSADIQRLLERALSDVSQGVLLSGIDRRITFVNQGFTRLTGYGAAELLGESSAILQGPDTDPATVERLKAALWGDGNFDGEILNYRKDGTEFWNSLLISPARDERGEMTGFLGIQRDITERKQAELALRESEERYRMLSHSVPVGIFHSDAQGECQYVNDSWCEMSGMTIAQAQGQGWVEALHPEDRARVFTEWDRAAQMGTEFRSEYRLRTPSGKVTWVHGVATVLRDQEGQITGHLGSLSDVTERHRVEARTEGERAVLELLASAAPLPAVLDRLARSYEEIFPGMLCSVLLLDAEGRHLRHGAAPSLPEAFCRAIDGVEIGPSVGSCGTAAFTRQTTLVDDIATDPLWKDYATLALDNGLRACWSVPVVSSKSRVLGTFALYYGEKIRPRPDEVDAIERGAHFASLAIQRHELLLSLRESQVRLETLVANLPGMAYRCQNDAQRTMTYVSKGCEAITGYRREELEENRAVAYGDLIHPDDRDALWAKFQKSLDARTPYQNEYRILDRHGREHWVSERASGVHSDDGALLFIDGFIQDITAARQAQIERKRLDRKMQETQKLESLGVLAGGIAHDFNNLLTSVMGNASLAALDLPTESPTLEIISEITQASARAAELCNQMLAYSGRGHFVVETLDLGQLVEQTAQMLQVSISKKAELRFQLENDLPPVEVDATQIRQVIMNLVINGSEALGEESGVISLSTGLARVDRAYLAETLMDSNLPEGEYVFLEVSDTGSGMSPEMETYIFDPFFTTKFAGRGLGLAAVLGIVRGHKGALKVSSEVGRGTTFRLLFPAAQGVSESVAATPAADIWRGKGSVLVADDEETVRSTLARMLCRLGLEPVLVPDGREAVEVFRDDPDRFAMVLLDLTMPHLDGEQTFAELRQLRPDMRVVLMSGFNAQEATLHFNGKGLANFLQKPFTMDALRAVLQSVMG